MSTTDYAAQKEILRELAKQVAEISALPIQDDTLKAWKGLNSLKPVRPMYMIEQLPWGQLNYDDAMTLKCTDGMLRSYEWQLRETLYRWRYFPDDRVVTANIRVPKSIHSTGYGFRVEEDLILGDAGTAANSHKYKSTIQTDEDIENIHFPTVTENKEASLDILNTAKDIFDGILTVRQGGVDNYGHIWDVVSTAYGIEEAMYDIADRPEFIHKVLDRAFSAYLHSLDQYEKLGLIDVGQPSIHCTGAYTDELPGFNNESEEDLEKSRYSAKNVWTYGAAQLFSMVSPETHDEFEIAYQMKWYARFGLGYYGCCEPLDRKVHIISKLPNVRKISMSTWVDMNIGSEAMAGRFVFSRKPNPYYLASDIAWDAELIEKDLKAACDVAARYGNPCELILKDVSTVGDKPQRLWEWAKIAAKVVGRVQ